MYEIFLILTTTHLCTLRQVKTLTFLRSRNSASCARSFVLVDTYLDGLNDDCSPSDLRAHGDGEQIQVIDYQRDGNIVVLGVAAPSSRES